jgi:hypothetical protein
MVMDDYIKEVDDRITFIKDNIAKISIEIKRASENNKGNQLITLSYALDCELSNLKKAEDERDTAMSIDIFSAKLNKS